MRPKDAVIDSEQRDLEASDRSSASASNASMPSERSFPSGESGVSGSVLPNQQQLHHVEGGRYGDVDSADAQEVPAPVVHSFATPCTRCNRLVASTRMCVCEGSQLELPPPSDSPQPLILPVVWVRVSVRDSGCGISPQNQRLLFHPFVQIDAEKTQGGKGSGLGLNICKKIVELFQGRIGIMSALNVGSEFYFVVPLQIAGEGDIEASAEWGPKWTEATAMASPGWGPPPAATASSAATATPLPGGAAPSTDNKESAVPPSITDASVPSMPTDESQFAFPPISPADHVRRSAALASDLSGLHFQSLPIRIMSAASHSKVLWDNVKDARTRRENQAALALKSAADAATMAVGAGAHTAAVVAAAAAAAVVAMGAPVKNAQAAAAAAAAAALQAASASSDPTPPPTPLPAAARNLRVQPVNVSSAPNAASAASTTAAAPASGVSPQAAAAPNGTQSPSGTSQASAPSQSSAPVSSTSSASSSRASQRSTADAFDGSLFTILLVDDVLMNCTLLKRLLVRHKFQVDVCFDGQQAVDRIANHPHSYQCVLMDNNMPVLGGMAATSALRRLGFSFPIIGVTGDVMPEERLQFLRAGANEVVPKPVDFAKLLAIIKMMLPSMEERRAQIAAVQQATGAGTHVEDAPAPRTRTPSAASSTQSARSHHSGSTDSSTQGSATSAPEPNNSPPLQPQQQQQQQQPQAQPLPPAPATTPLSPPFSSA